MYRSLMAGHGGAIAASGRSSHWQACSCTGLLMVQLADAKLEMQTQKDTIIRLSSKKPDTEVKDRLVKLVDKYEQAKTKVGKVVGP